MGRSFQELLEVLALHLHQNLLLQHPDALWQTRKDHVPYEDLPGTLRSYQRHRAEEALGGILAQGFRIEPPPTPELALAVIRERAEALLAREEPLQAYDVLREGLRNHPGHPVLRHLEALALMECGAPLAAADRLAALMGEGFQDASLLASRARAHRELGERSTLRENRIRHYQRARALYQEAYALQPSPWVGLQAATLALLAWEVDSARPMAAAVVKQCRQAFEDAMEAGRDAYWILVALGLASLVQGGWEAARPHIQEAAEHGASRARDLASLRHEARRLMVHLGEDPTPLDRILPVPKVVVFAGHLVDFPDRPDPRFPASAEAAVQAALDSELRRLDAWCGFSSAAAGSQILFLERMHALGAEINLVLPFEPEAFLPDSVAIRPDGQWPERFQALRTRARAVYTASTERIDEGSTAFRYNNELLIGLAALKAHQLHADLIPLVLWDGVPSAASGSIAATVEAWTNLGHAPRILNLSAITGLPAPMGPPRPARSQPSLEGDLDSQVRIMLFADVVQFSRLGDPLVPRFVAHFLGALRDLEAHLPIKPLIKNTWGDGLFYVFEGLGDAAAFAQSLVDAVAGTRWEDHGLPAGLDLRVALHAGPVFTGHDPITGRPTCFGSHVNRAARIEPITPPGHVYCSQAFAALAAAQGVPGILCEYVGRLPLAKGFGTFPMYLMRVLD